MSNLNQLQGHIANEWRILQEQWEDTCQYWKDPAQQRFERELWKEYEQMFPVYLRKLEETLNLVAKACRELRL